jgi:hypothetical protein
MPDPCAPAAQDHLATTLRRARRTNKGPARSCVTDFFLVWGVEMHYFGNEKPVERLLLTRFPIMNRNPFATTIFFGSQFE